MAPRQASAAYAGTRALLTEQAQGPRSRRSARASEPASATSSRRTASGNPRTTARPCGSRLQRRGRAA
eukprot:6324692-Alexandrium_andersonii.AAC.1